ncbi:MAG TPA: aminotransferase class V-fold PLP-dependent enzyme [Geobacteraceae bacterium]
MAIYLDNAATTYPKPEVVYQAVERAMREIGVGPARGGYDQGLAASRLVFAARESLADFFCIADSSRLVFTHSATESLNLAIAGLLRPGDHVVTTTMEHNSLVRPLKLAEARGVTVTWVKADSAGYVTAASIGEAITPVTRLVAISHCSNVTGAVQPVGEIGILARAAGIPLLVDAAQSAGSIPIDVAAMHIDLLAVPGHKGLLGPQGTGLLYIAPGLELEPLLVGGTGGQSSALVQPQELPERFESGTHNTPGIAGLLAAVEFIRETGLATIMASESRLTHRLLTGLHAIAGVTVYNPIDTGRPRGAVVSFTAAAEDPARIGYILNDTYGIAVRIGLHCAPLAHQTIGTYPAGTVRISPGYFTTDADIEAVLAAVREIVER